MRTLQAALDWAARGFPVFPLAARTKNPIYDDWPSYATTDPEAIRRMWVDPITRVERDYNIGALCTDRVVVDIDVKNGKDGYNEYMQMGGSYDTLVVRTPTGGFHCYFEGPDSSNAPLSKAVDVRSHNGFVVAPGSVLDEGTYEIVTDKAPAWVPTSIEKMLRDPYERKQGAVHEALDSPASIEAGRRYLESAPVAVEGQRGDDTTFQTAARLVREFALSTVTAYQILAEDWNLRCVPPWPLDELYRKVENAAEYGTAQMGRLDPSVMFAGVNVSPPPSVFEQHSIGFGNAVDPQKITPRPWIIDRLLMREETTLLLAPGSAGKSSVALAIVAHLALGIPFGDYATHVACKSIVYNGEDSVMEMSRRLLAVCRSYNLDFNEVRKHVMLLSSDTVDLRLVHAQGRIPVVNEAVYNQLVRLASDPAVGCVVYDPLVDVHDCDEGDNPQMNAVMRTLHNVAREASVANLVLHHTTKAGSAKQEDRVGNMDIARGASGIVYKSRISFTLMNATTQDCEEFGLQDHERTSWVRMDDAKMNLALASGDPTWFRKDGIRIESGDTVGVLKHENMKRNAGQLRIRVAELLLDTMTANGSGSMTLSQAALVVKNGEPLYANRSDTELKKKLEGMFATRTEVKGRSLHVKREGEGSKMTVRVVME